MGKVGMEHTYWKVVQLLKVLLSRDGEEPLPRRLIDQGGGPLMEAFRHRLSSPTSGVLNNTRLSGTPTSGTVTYISGFVCFMYCGCVWVFCIVSASVCDWGGTLCDSVWSLTYCVSVYSLFVFLLFFCFFFVLECILCLTREKFYFI